MTDPDVIYASPLPDDPEEPVTDPPDEGDIDQAPAATGAGDGEETR